MDCKDMTLTELSEALRTPTPELIDELKKRVWEAMGNCLHTETFKSEVVIGPLHYRLQCTKATCRKRFVSKKAWEWETWLIREKITVPDITKPEVWVPIAMNEPKITAVFVDKVRGVSQVDFDRTWGKLTASDCVIHAETYIAVGLACLQIKENEK